MRIRLLLPVILLCAHATASDSISRAAFLFNSAFPPTGTITAPPLLEPEDAAKMAAGPHVTNRQGDVHGDVYILQYHGISPVERRYDRSRENFRNDLERLYKDGFRPVTMTDYVENHMVVPHGASPVVMTFDDANPTQFKILPNGEVDPNCAIGIWQAFYKTHPDFPMKGMFYVVPTMMFGQRKLVDVKIKMLEAWGSEIGNHTMTHPFLSRLSDAAATKEIGSVMVYLAKKGITQHVHFCIPYGIFPRNRKLVESVTWAGKTWRLESNTLCGANPAPAPTSPKFKPYRIPRILSNEEPDGINYWMDQAEKGSVHLYVEP